MKSYNRLSAIKKLLIVVTGLVLLIKPGAAQQPVTANQTLLGELSTGEKVYAVQSSPGGGWGLSVVDKEFRKAGQPKPMKLQFYENDNKITDLDVSYKSFDKTGAGFIGSGDISPVQGLVFKFEDTWTISGNSLNMNRKVVVQGNATGGFVTGISFILRTDFSFPNVRHFAPGMSYGTPDYLSARAPGGPTNYNAGRFNVREEDFTIPMCGIWYNDSSSVILLNSTPKGNTTATETNDRRTALTDKRFLFGELGANNIENGGITLSYLFPGCEPTRRRYHPVENGFKQEYNISFRFGSHETYHTFYSSSWRWGWATLKPALNPYDMAMVQKSLVDHLSGLVYKYEDRTGIPF